jgi:hypothetical protein
MLHYIILRCYSIYISMLHSVVFPYVCNAALEVFRAPGTEAAIGNEVYWRTGTRTRWGTEDKGTVNTIPFRSIPIIFLFALRGQASMERGAASGHISCARCLGSRITMGYIQICSINWRHKNLWYWQKVIDSVDAQNHIHGRNLTKFEPNFNQCYKHEK